MTQDLLNLLQLLSSGLTIWILCLGAFACLLIDSLWPKKMTALVYTIGIISLSATLGFACLQWFDLNHAKTTIVQDLLIMDLTTLSFLIIILVIGIITLFNALAYLKIHQNLSAEFCSLVLFSIIGMVFLFAQITFSSILLDWRPCHYQFMSSLVHISKTTKATKRQ
jgi:NADH:ubiquinone oxidoreductase subunit 2 (subunit N)